MRYQHWRMGARRFIVPCVVLCAHAGAGQPSPADGCLVCERMMQTLRSVASQLPQSLDASTARENLDGLCALRLSTSEERLCYILDPMKAQVVDWLVLGLEPRRICARVNKMNGDTCALRATAGPDASAAARTGAGPSFGRRATDDPAAGHAFQTPPAGLRHQGIVFA